MIHGSNFLNVEFGFICENSYFPHVFHSSIQFCNEIKAIGWLLNSLAHNA